MVTALVGHLEPILATIKWHKLVWFGYVTQHDTLSKTVLNCILKGDWWYGGRRNWLTNMKEWIGHLMQDLLTIAQDRPEWQALSTAISIRVLSCMTGTSQRIIE